MLLIFGQEERYNSTIELLKYIEEHRIHVLKAIRNMMTLPSLKACMPKCACLFCTNRAQKLPDMRTRAVATVPCIPTVRCSKWRRTNQNLTRHSVWLAIRFKIMTSCTWAFLPRIIVYNRYVWAIYNHLYRVYTRI